jgi:uroporphyrinogen III methyltransferase/synthase
VVYDALIDRRLLDLVPENAEKICVGKRSGRHSETQENINRILTEKALGGLTVARLKGGDPFVFGRGGEEILALQEAEIPYTLVPGVTSAVAVPELGGVPVTHRSTARSFHVITGHTGDGLALDGIEKYARVGGTLVFLMGLNRLAEIADSLIEGGMLADTPSAVISHGATARQRIVRAPLSEISETVKNSRLCAPAVIVVGQTAGYDFAPNLRLPLDGVSVGVTGTKRFTGKLSAELSRLGADVRKADFLEVCEYADNAPFDEAVLNIGSYGWVVLTSINGAEIFFSRMKRLGVDLRRTAGLKYAVIGSGTANALSQRGIFADLVPESFTSADLGNALAENVKKGERVLILRAENGSAELSKILEENEIDFDDIKTYRVSDSGADFAGLGGCRFVTFASASGVNAFFERGCGLPDSASAVCIGDITANALESHGIKDYRIAKSQNVTGIIETILEAVK